MFGGADLADMQLTSKLNKGFRSLLLECSLFGQKKFFLIFLPVTIFLVDLDHIKTQNTNFRGKSPKSSICPSPIDFGSQICEKNLSLKNKSCHIPLKPKFNADSKLQ